MIDKLYTKRYCLPSSNSISLLDENKYTPCIACSGLGYNHAACIFRAKGCNDILTYGMNKYMDIEGVRPSIHAEHNAIDKLPCLRRNRNPVNINLLVVRMSRTGKLGSSKPCINCIQTMTTLPLKKGYKIQYVYYSDRDGNIIETTIRKLEAEEYPHISGYWKNKMSSMP